MKYIIDEVTKDTKYITGHENGTLFGMRNIPAVGLYNNYHIGNDYNLPSGTKLYAPVRSKVLKIVDYDDHTGYGYAIFLYMLDYDKTLHLAHMRGFANIKEGQVLERGALVGYSGGAKGERGAGTSTGAHLHLGIASGKRTNTVKGKLGDGTWLNPSNFDFNAKVSNKPTLSLEEVVQGVIDGKYGNGQERVSKVKATGYDYNTVQEKVNERLSGVKPQASEPSSKFQFKVGDVLEISGHYPTVHNGSFISTPKKHVIVKKIFPKDHYPYQVTDEKGNILGGVDPVNVYRVVKRNVKPTPSKSIVRGSKVSTTAKKDIFGTNLDPNTVNANKTFTVEQVGRNGNANHVLLKEIMTWVEKTTLKVV